MSYKTLLVHVEATPESDLRLRLAVELAHQFSARLIGVGGRVAAYVDSNFMGTPDGPTLQQIAELDSADLAEAAARFHRLAGQLGDSVAWRSGEDYPDRMLQRCAAGADLIVASASRGPQASTVDAGELALKAGVPVLTIPTDLTVLRRKHIVVGWKNTREARRAVSDAMPLLVAADQVCVVQVEHEADVVDMWDGLHGVVDRLKGHGVTASAETIAGGSADAPGDLISFSEQRLADLIVSGAFGHSRLREWTLGGFTRGLLKQSTLPVLFSH